jgi:hypothetical protein
MNLTVSCTSGNLGVYMALSRGDEGRQEKPL